MKNDKMPSLPAPVIIKLESDWFKAGYYIYVVTIKYNSKNYFYVGMTGDRNHLTARSPFYRISGHFIQGKSTQNQIIKGIEKKLKLSVTADLLCQMNFTYYAWLLNSFVEGDPDYHKTKREYGEQVESALISLLRQNYGQDAIFNSKLSRQITREHYIVAEQIFTFLQQTGDCQKS